MKLPLSYLIILLMVFSGNAQTTEAKIDTYVDAMSERYEIPGAAVAVIQDGEIIYKKYYGMSNLENNNPITEKALFKLHSLSKIFVATAIFQLIENGKLSLEDEASDYVPGLPAIWQKVKIKHLLTHSSGLPDIIRYEASNEEDHKAKVFEGAIAFEPGNQFSYNQTNFWLLNRIIARITNSSLEDYVIVNQFQNDKDALVFAQNMRAMNRVTEYFPNKEGVMEAKEFEVPEYMYGAAGIALTLDEFIEWNQNLDNNVFLEPQTKAMMWSPFPYKNGHRFAYSWGLEKANGHRAIGFSGGSIVSLRKYIDNDITVIFLSTGYRYFPNVNRIANYIAGIVDQDLEDDVIIAGEALTESFLKRPLKDAIDHYKKLKKNNSKMNLESTLNTIGYSLAGREKFEEAIAVFLLNTKENPDSWNVWDSLAEGYEMSGDMESAIANYKKSVALNPENVHGIEKLEKLEK